VGDLRRKIDAVRGVCQHRRIEAVLVVGLLCAGSSAPLASPPSVSAEPPATAATRDTPDSLVARGLRYEHAEGVPRDFERAVQLYCQAAERGSARAAYNIAIMRLNGRGIERSDGKAVTWLRHAAAAHDEHAEQLLRRLTASPQPDQDLCRAKSAGDAEVGSGEKILDIPLDISARVRRLAPVHGLDERLVSAVIAVESDFNALAVSPANAQGLMQLIPETSTRFGIRDAFDPDQNLEGGMRYLRWLLARFKGDVTLALAGYNAGENAVLRYQGVPPYPETLKYIQKVRRYYGRLHHPVATPGEPLAGATIPPAQQRDPTGN
jgi:soluble lytic murein transglycosylase-like protein